MGDGPSECNIKVICRVRPLNESEERAGSKFVLKFPTEDSISVAVSLKFCYAIFSENLQKFEFEFLLSSLKICSVLRLWVY